MSSTIQVSRGSLKAKGADNLTDGELFWQRRNVTSDTSKSKYDEGTLFIGKPDLSASGAIPIAGTRTFKALRYYGNITVQTSISDTLFNYVNPGDFFIFSNDAAGGVFKLTDDFRKNDILLITASTINETTGIATGIGYKRLYGSSGFSEDIYFDNAGTNFSATDVKSALKELEVERLMYAGTLSSQTQVSACSPDIGALYLCTTDGLLFNSGDYAFSVIRGDFVFWDKSDASNIKWTKIPSGYSDSTLIDYNGAASSAALMSTSVFNQTHISAVAGCKNVDEILNFLAVHKAELDSNNKIPVSQLPDTVLGALQYQGTWNPVLTASAYSTAAGQNPWPDASPEAGDYYIVSISDSSIIKMTYYDKLSATGTDTYSRSIELATGDWIVWTVSGGTGSWEKVDNTDRISAISFRENANLASGSVTSASSETIVEKTYVPSLGSSHKIGLYENSGTLYFAGINLVDQTLGTAGTDTYIPRYSGGTNTIKNSHVQDNDSSVIVHEPLQVGAPDELQNLNTYGNVNMYPKFNGTSKKLAPALSISVSKNGDTSETYRTLWLYPDSSQADGAVVYLPNASSTLVGRLSGVSLSSSFITKSTTDGYIESSSVQEFMSGGSADSVYVNAPTLSVAHQETRRVRVGSSDGSFALGHFGASEIYSDIVRSAATYQTSNITVTLPSRTGTLVTDTDLNEQFTGSESYIAVFNADITTNGVSRKTLKSSFLYQDKSSRVSSLLGSSASTRTDSDKAWTASNAGRAESVVSEADIVVGNGGSANRNLFVTGSLIAGNSSTNSTIISPGRSLHSGSTQYLDAYTGNALGLSDVYLEMPPVSGVLLTDNSRIDGGLYE